MHIRASANTAPVTQLCGMHNVHVLYTHTHLHACTLIFTLTLAHTHPDMATPTHTDGQHTLPATVLPRHCTDALLTYAQFISFRPRSAMDCEPKPLSPPRSNTITSSGGRTSDT